MKIILLSMAIMSCKVNAPKVAHSRLDHYLAKSPVFSHAHTGLIVYDPEADQILYEHNGDDLFTPASNTKLWTVYAGMKILGDSLPSVKYCEADGKRYIRAMADPTLLHPVFKRQPVADFLGLSHDTLHLSIQALSTQRFGAGWAWDDYPYSFQPERSALPLYGNVVRVTMPAQSNDIDISPQYFASHFDVHCDSLSLGTELTREEWSNQFRLKHSCVGTSDEVVVPFINSDSLTAVLLSQALDVPVMLENNAMEKCQWKVLYSQPMDSLFLHILIDSDNFMAEQLLLMCALALSNTLDPAIAINHIMTNDFPHLLDAIHWEDGSGLSRYNQFTPQSMVELLTKLYRSPGVERWIGLLPAGGRSGTLRNSFGSSKPYIFAKTGSMRYVYNLSGFLMADSGKILIFSFMNNHFNVAFDELKSQMSAVLTTFKEKY